RAIRVSPSFLHRDMGILLGSGAPSRWCPGLPERGTAFQGEPEKITIRPPERPRARQPVRAIRAKPGPARGPVCRARGPRGSGNSGGRLPKTPRGPLAGGMAVAGPGDPARPGGDHLVLMDSDRRRGTVPSSRRAGPKANERPSRMVLPLSLKRNSSSFFIVRRAPDRRAPEANVRLFR